MSSYNDWDNDEWEDTGAVVMRPKRQSTFVPALRKEEIKPLPNQEITIGVDHPARQVVQVRTSAVDRAKGYQLVITPLALALAFLAVLVSLTLENEFFSFASFLIFWLVFCAVWLAGWIVTAMATPEFVSWYSAKRQWNVIEREQFERWEHYKWQTGRTKQIEGPTPAPGRTVADDLRLAMIIGCAVGFPLALALLAMGVLQ
jgi:hypothetical protein